MASTDATTVTTAEWEISGEIAPDDATLDLLTDLLLDLCERDVADQDQQDQQEAA